MVLHSFCLLTTEFKLSLGKTFFAIFQDIQKLEQYLPLLENFIRQVDSIIRNKSLLILELRIQWSSTLSTKFLIGGPKHFQINSLQYELAMILFFYGITTRQRAFEVFSEGWYLKNSVILPVYHFLLLVRSFKSENSNPLLP